jgi:indolepyruvate ferredoxin oxidoreductase alpha subunit
MGAGITQAQGLNLVEPDTLNFAFIGDSTFFHSGITGIVNAVFNNANIIVVVLDNATTAMTGGQTHPGIGRTLMNKPSPKISIYNIISAIGVSNIWRVNAFDFEAGKAAVSEAICLLGVRVVIFEGLCIHLEKNTKPLTVTNACISCGRCVKMLGCPALEMSKTAVIDPSRCTGCGLCASVCPVRAILPPEEVTV